MKQIVLSAIMAIAIAAQAQHVGVGTAAPQDRLHVAGGNLRIENSTNNTLLRFINGGVVQGYTGVQNNNVYLATMPGVNTTGKLLLRTGSTDHLVVEAAGNVGIGISSPAAKLHVAGATAADAASNIVGSNFNIYATTGQLLQFRFMDNFLAPRLLGSFDYSGIARSQWKSGTVATLTATGLGIDIANPLTKLHIPAGQDASLATNGNGYMMLGAGSGPNLVVDNNEIIARDNSGISTLYLQAAGGNTETGKSPDNIRFTGAGEINRPAVTGTGNLVPLCYGKISSTGGFVAGTLNFSVAKPGTGRYEITIFGETNMANSPAQYIVMASATEISGATGFKSLHVTGSVSTTGNAVIIDISRPDVDKDLVSVRDGCEAGCGNRIVDLIKSYGSRGIDKDFCFIVYKL